MAPKTLIFGAIAVLSAYTWQVFLHDLLFYAIGIGREVHRIEEYPYTCRQLRHPLLESCEDLALDEEGRTLYAACSNSLARKGWSPGLVSSIRGRRTKLMEEGGINSTLLLEL
jgi:hypothetical protein